MEVYKILNLDNNDILLEKITINTNEYEIINKANGDILLKNKGIIINDIKEIKKYEFKKSAIIECKINNIIIDTLKYKPIIEYIYYLINDGVKIIINTKLNIKTIKKLDEGYSYLEQLGISFQNVDANKSILEILNQCLKNNISINIKIKLIDNNLINIIL